MDLDGLSNAHDFFSGFVSTFLIYGYVAFVAVRGAGGPMMICAYKFHWTNNAKRAEQVDIWQNIRFESLMGIVRLGDVVT